MTRTCSLEWSCTTLAITEAWAFSSVPGCSVAKPMVCALAPHASAASTGKLGNRISLSMLASSPTFLIRP